MVEIGLPALTHPLMSKKNKPDKSVKVTQRDKIQYALNLKSFNLTEKQQDFLDLALDKQSKVIFVNGPAGTSKTFIATYAALKLLDLKKESDILYVRAAVESSDSKLGFLPGTAEEKIHAYGMPLLDKLDELLPRQQVDKLLADTRISIVPVGFTRGLNWNAKIIIVDEAQNLTQKELITILTRVGQFSKCFVLADPMQSDINGKGGAFERIAALFDDETSEEQGIHYFEFNEEDIMRSELCKFLVKRFNWLNKPKEAGH